MESKQKQSKKQLKKKSNKQGRLVVHLNLHPKTLERVIVQLNSLLAPSKESKLALTVHDMCKTFKDRVAQASPENRMFFYKARRSLVKEMFGTQEPTVRLRTESVTDGWTTGILDVYAYAINWYNVHDQSQWQSLFDEYIIRSGSVHWMSLLGSATNDTNGGLTNLSYNMVGVIDYEDGTQITSFDGATVYDTHQVHPLSSTNNKVHSWPFKCQGQPDLAWTATNTDKTVCYWKWFANLISGNLSYGYCIWGDVHVSFRQLVQ